MRKRVAVICQYELLEHRVGGMDQFFWSFDKKCKDEGIDLDWFFPNQASHGEYSKMNIISAEYKGLEMFFLNYLENQTFTYDIVMTHFLELCTFFTKDVKKLGCKQLIQVDHNPRPYGGYPFVKRIKKRLKWILYSPYVDRFIGVSKNTSKEIVNDFGPRVQSRTDTIYNGVNLDAIMVKKESRKSRPPKFMVVSHLRKSKGIQDLIKAVSMLQGPIKDKMVVDVFGSGPFEQELKNLVEALGCDNNFKFLGSTAVLERYQEYDYLIQPTYMECMSLSILEALSAGISLITTPVGGTPEVVTQGVNGFLFEPGDIQALGEILTRCITQKNLIKGPVHPTNRDQFTLDFMVEEYFKLIAR